MVNINVTLSGAAQNLLTVLGLAKDMPLYGVTFQAGVGNAGSVYIGLDSGVSSTHHCWSIGPAASGVAPVPLVIFPSAQRVSLGSLWVIGTSTQLLHVTGVEM